MTPYAVSSGDLVYQVGEAATELRIREAARMTETTIVRTLGQHCRIDALSRPLCSGRCCQWSRHSKPDAVANKTTERNL